MPAPLLPPRVVETHGAHLTFLGDRVYKRKKPIDLGFVDWTTRPSREAACRFEYTLNHRLSPDVYLGVGDLVDDDGAAVDHVVVMRRLPDERRLSVLLDGDTSDAELDAAMHAIARQVATFHAAAPHDAALDHWAGRAAIAENWADNLAVLRRAVPDLVAAADVDEIAALAEEFLRVAAHRFDERLADGHVRDGHGDLLVDDIFLLEDGPRILDGLDFADRYRYGDVLLDAAFLAMDLERHGRPDLAQRFLATWAEHAGDLAPPGLTHFFVAYRASVRAKIDQLRAEQTGRRAGSLRTYVRIMQRHLRRARPLLVLVGGLPGSGKSTLAGRLGDQLDGTVLRTDTVRRERYGPPGSDDADRYRDERIEAVYAEVVRRAGVLLSRGERVVLDASWTTAAFRAHAERLAEELGVVTVRLECRAPWEVLRERLVTRDPQGSDATPEVLATMAARWAPWDDATPIATDRDVEDVVRAAHRAVQAGERARVVARQSAANSR